MASGVRCCVQVWFTYRAGFPEPIRDLVGVEVLGPPLAFPLPPASAGHGPPSAGVGAPPMHSPKQSDASLYACSSPSSSTHGHACSHASHSTSSSTTSSSGNRKWWRLSLGNTGGSKGRSSDAGWAACCGPRRAFANDCLDPNRSPTILPCPPPSFPPPSPSSQATHAHLLFWFADAPAAPSSVHRMALAGKRKVGKDVGMWFGPSAAGVAVKMLVEGFEGCGMGVAVAADGTPVYYDTMKTLFTFPQSVGDGDFYPDPHHSRPTVPLRLYLEGDNVYNSHQAQPHPPSHKRTASYGHGHPHLHERGGSMSPERAGSMSSERRGSLSLELERRGGSLSPDPYWPMTETSWCATFVVPSRPASARCTGRIPPTLVLPHWQRAHSLAELQTFHCDRVRKMPMAGLDPSMLIGFLVRSEDEWLDLRRRITEGEDAEVEVDDGDASSVSHASCSSNWSHPPVSSRCTYIPTHSKSTTGTSTGSSASQVDMEDDAAGPITPLPGSSFDLSIAANAAAAGVGGRKGKEPEWVVRDEDDDEDDFVDAATEVLDDNDPEEEEPEGGDIEDDWVDPVSTSAPAPVVVAPPPPVKKVEVKVKAGIVFVLGVGDQDQDVDVDERHWECRGAQFKKQ
uniref:Cysteine protease n=1 Tax=Mycena chlorophos TaxID=658473 RepID=A0ABQ0KUU8_MYCCL|nr:predicted protein [Mycena chlorophos]